METVSVTICSGAARANGWAMSRRLEGAGLVVTRPAGAKDRLAGALAAEGARILAFPALEIVPLGDAPIPAGRFDAALFTSPAAARLGAARLGGRLPSEVFAPGRGTRDALAEAGVATAITPAKGAGLRPLLDSLPANALRGKRLLLVGAETPDPAGLEALADRGAKVTAFAVYSRRPARNREPLSGWIRGGDADAIMASSVAAVAALSDLLGAAAVRIGWIVSSRRVAEAVERAGARPLAVAASAEAGEMLATTIHWWLSKGGDERT